MDDLLVPPANFAMVDHGVFRSGFPQKCNFGFLKTLKLQSIVAISEIKSGVYAVKWDQIVQRQYNGRRYLCAWGNDAASEVTPKRVNCWLKTISKPPLWPRLVRVPLRIFGRALPLGLGPTSLNFFKHFTPCFLFTEIHREIIKEALKVILDEQNYPLLIHCRSGKHRTGCVVGCIRKMQRWCLLSIVEEYRQFAGAKARNCDERFIEFFDVSNLKKSSQPAICFRNTFNFI
ncbi:Phosphotyrosine protein phosphatases superfamily protein [Rhynchospora pubera]|uniref:Phosphotyrosine protein phosphatases superfamily protein n=1 Tax=Rhynchospora pubera TaxID=906938 RepID=A0AAV8H460_9POAL|nr:Phosphotyrosine protein phosphatases superfamily protein [Rhynchospora pubera]